MATVTFDDVQRIYPGAESAAVKNFTLDVHDGEFMVLVGPSGSGKSTALRMLAGLEDLTKGRILIDDRDVTNLPPKDRDIAMVFQNYALYPHLNVGENLALSLKAAQVDKAEQTQRVAEAATLLDLDALLDRKPQALSEGQRHRVAMGRALVLHPRVFCLDEPLSNLDTTVRVNARTRIESLQKRLGVTALYATRDQTEAMTMGNRVAVMRGGVLQQVGSPLHLFDRPTNMFVAGFIGSPAMNFFTDRVDLARVHLGTMALPVTPSTGTMSGAEIALGVRPTAWRIVPNGEQALSVTINLVEELGAETLLHTTADITGAPTDVVIHTEGARTHHTGDVLHLTCDKRDVHLFAIATGQRVPSRPPLTDVPW